MKFIFTLILIFITSNMLAAPAKIIIIPFSNATNDKKNISLEKGIPEILTVCLTNFPELVSILDRTSLDSNIEEQSLSWGKYVSENSIQSIGNIVGADYVLRGSIISKEDGYEVQALLFNVASTQLQESVSGNVDIDNIVDSLCENITKPLVKKLDNNNKNISLVSEENPEKQQLLIKGLNYYFNGNYAQSFSPLLKLVKDYPNDPVAHFWLAKSFYRAGMDDFAYIQFKDFINRFQDNSRVFKVKSMLTDIELRRDKENPDD